MFPGVCRVCLAADVRMLSMDVQLLGIYEKLTSTQLIPGDECNKLCYICHSQLQKCRRFCKMARRSEKYMNFFLENDIKANDKSISDMLKKTKLKTLSVINLKPISLDGLWKGCKTKTNLNKTQLEGKTIKEVFNETPTKKGVNIEGSMKLETPTEEGIIKNDNNTKGFVNNINNTKEGFVKNELINKVITKNVIAKKGFTKYDPNERLAKLGTKTQVRLNKKEIFIKGLKKYELPTKKGLGKNESQSNKGLIKNKTPSVGVNEITLEGLMKNKTNQDELIEAENCTDKLIYFDTEDVDLLEDFTDVKDYVVINDTELYYECSECHNIFKTREELTTHQTTHKTETKRIYKLEDIMEKIPDTGPPYCPICKKFFAGYGSQLQEHLRIHTGERPFVCDLCGKTSRTKHHLKEHIRTHTKEKVYCKVCNKAFSQLSSLGKHMLIHTGQSPYCCHVCGKSFKQNGQMKAHIRFIHEGVRPYGCDVCGKRFPAKSEWRRHMDAHSGIKAHSCDRCGTKFATNAAVVRHKKHYCKMSG